MVNSKPLSVRSMMDEALKKIAQGGFIFGETPRAPVDEELRSRVEKRRLFIMIEGRKVAGIADGHGPQKIPPWYDPVAFKRAQDLFYRYSTIIRISQFYNLLLVYCDHESIAPLLVTGNSRTVAKLYIRYLSTMVHITNWFTYDPFDPESKAYRSTKTVRGYHRKVAEQMNEKNNLVLTSSDDLWMSQFAMSQAQFTFMGLMAIFPQQLGFSHFSPEDFHAIYHFWRVIGYCLGVEDRFNLCSETDDETRELCRQIYDVWRPKILASEEPTGTAMTRGIALGMAQVVRTINYNAMLRYAAPFLGLNIEDYPLSSLKDYADYAAMSVVYRLGGSSKLLSIIGSRLTEVSIRGSGQLRQVHQRYLEALYDGKFAYEPDARCPFQVEINYKTAFDLGLD